MTEDLIIRKTGRVGHISLNRPKVIHSLNLDMCLGTTEAPRKEALGRGSWCQGWVDRD